MMDNMNVDMDKKFMLEVANDLLDENLSAAKYLLKPKLSETELGNIRTGLDLIETLERNVFQPMETLKNILRDIKRQDLVSKITEQEKSKSSGPTRVHIEKTVPYFVETSYCQTLNDRMTAGNMVILKGIAASGKSQLAFWYASKFKEANPNSIICTLQCTSLDELLQSMQQVLIYLKVPFESKETDKEKYIQQMSEMARDKLCQDKFRDSQHLLIFNDIQCSKMVSGILKSLMGDDNLKLLCTTNNDDFFALESKHVMDPFIHVKGVMKDEVIKFFPRPSHQETMEEDAKAIWLSDLKLLASELDYLPLSLICAERYMEKTHIDVKGYMKRLQKNDKFLDHVENVLKDEIHDYSKGLVAALKISLDNVTQNVKRDSTEMLQMMQFLDKNDIPRFLLLCLLPDVSKDADKVTQVDAMIANLKKYSLCVIQGSGKDSKLSIHAMTRHVLLSTMSDDEKRNMLKKLVYIFCRNMNVDARCKDILTRNLCFLRHAQIVLNKFQKHFQNAEEDIEIKLLNFCLATLIGVTFCQYGNEDLLAEEYLKKAKTLLFKLAETNYEDVEVVVREKHSSSLEYREHDLSSEKDSWPWIMNLFRTNNVAKNDDSDENRAISKLFDKLVSKGNTIPDDFLKKVVIHTVRSFQDMQHIKIAAENSGMSQTEMSKCGKSHLTYDFFEEMVKKGLAKPMKLMKKVFLVESLIAISYNSARNLYKWKSKDDVAVTQRQCDFRLSFLLAQELKKQLPEYASVYHLITKRNSWLYYVVTNIENATTEEKINRFREAIRTFENLLEVNENYFEFGIIKLGKWHSPHNRGMCLQHLVRCCSELYTLCKEGSERNKMLEEGLKHSKELASQAEKTHEYWIAASGFYFHIGKFHKTAGRENDWKLAISHFKRAIELHREFEMYGVSHIYLEASFELVECYIRLRDNESLLQGKTICEGLIASLHKSNKPEFLKRAEQALEEITRSVKE